MYVWQSFVHMFIAASLHVMLRDQGIVQDEMERGKKSLQDDTLAKWEEYI